MLQFFLTSGLSGN